MIEKDFTGLKVGIALQPFKWAFRAMNGEEPDMEKQTADQGWEQLQIHIAEFLGQTLRGDVQKIEYTPRFNSRLTEMPAGCHQNDRETMTA
jgi:hypothetical protein